MFAQRASALLIGTTMLAGSAFAQTTPTPSTTTPAPMANPPMATTAPGAMATPAAGGQFLTDQGRDQFRASKFVGVSIYGPDNARIGDINEVLIDGTGQAKAVVIGVGGFLGIGEKNVALPWSEIGWMMDRPNPATTGSTTAAPTMGGAATGTMTTTAAPARTPAEQAAYNGYPDHGMIKLTKADLQNAPTFRYYADTHATSGATNAAPAAKP